MSRTGQRPPANQGYKRNQAPPQQRSSPRQPAVKLKANAGLQQRAAEEPRQHMAANQPGPQS
ncbi:hypothetical protein AB4Z21_27120, partial [Paenibacillus sp. MCAF20]